MVASALLVAVSVLGVGAVVGRGVEGGVGLGVGVGSVLGWVGCSVGAAAVAMTLFWAGEDVEAPGCALTVEQRPISAMHPPAINPIVTFRLDARELCAESAGCGTVYASMAARIK